MALKKYAQNKCNELCTVPTNNNKPEEITIFIEDSVIGQVNSNTYLLLVMDEKLNRKKLIHQNSIDDWYTL